MTLMQLYLFTVILPNYSVAFSTLMTVFIAAGVVFGIISFLTFCEEMGESRVLIRKNCTWWVKFLSFGAVMFLFIASSLPTTTQLYTIAGGYVATNAKDVGKLPDNVVKAANAWLEKAADSANSEKKK